MRMHPSRRARNLTIKYKRKKSCLLPVQISFLRRSHPLLVLLDALTILGSLSIIHSHGGRLWWNQSGSYPTKHYTSPYATTRSEPPESSLADQKGTGFIHDQICLSSTSSDSPPQSSSAT